MMQRRKLPKLNDDVIAVAFDPTEIMLRKSGKQYYGQEKHLIKIEDGCVIFDPSVAEEFGLQIKTNVHTALQSSDRYTALIYYAGDGYWIDLVTDTQQSTRSAWLSHEEYGTKIMLIGVDCKDVPTIEGMRRIVEDNLNEGIEVYKKKVMHD